MTPHARSAMHAACTGKVDELVKITPIHVASIAFSLQWSKSIEATLYMSMVVLANRVIIFLKHPVSDSTQNDQIVRTWSYFNLLKYM